MWLGCPALLNYSHATMYCRLIHLNNFDNECQQMSGDAYIKLPMVVSVSFCPVTKVGFLQQWLDA